MRTVNQYALNTFRQVQTFLDENAAKIGALADSEGKKLLDASVAQLEAHGLNQSRSALEIDGHLSVQKSMEIDLRKEHMIPIASFARARLRGVPDYATLTRSTVHIKGRALVLAARAMAKAAQPYAEAFSRGGFPADALSQLDAAADKLEAALDGRANLKVQRVGATYGIGEQTKQGHEAVKMLGAVIERQFAKDKTFLAAWRSAKRVVAKPGLPRGSAVPSVPITSVAATLGAEK